MALAGRLTPSSGTARSTATVKLLLFGSGQMR